VPLPPVPGRMAPTGNFWGPGVPTWGGGVNANLQPARVRSESQTVARPGEWNAVGGSCQPSLRPPHFRVNLLPALKLGPSRAGCVLIDCWLCLVRVAVAAATDLGMDGAIGWYGPGSSCPPSLDASTAAALVRQAQKLTARCADLAPQQASGSASRRTAPRRCSSWTSE